MPKTISVGPVVVQVYNRTDFWVRVFGRGVSLERPAHPDGWVSFSERNGYQKAWHVFGACVKLLPKRPTLGENL